MPLLPDDAGEPSTEGGPAHHATTDQYPLTKALPGLAGIGHNWGVECTAHTGIPSRRGWSVTARSMKRAPGRVWNRGELPWLSTPEQRGDRT